MLHTVQVGDLRHAYLYAKALYDDARMRHGGQGPYIPHNLDEAGNVVTEGVDTRNEDFVAQFKTFKVQWGKRPASPCMRWSVAWLKIKL